MTQPVAVQSLSGITLREMFAAATTWLEANREQVNAINVFPVPDGDTGTNMFLTMRATMEEAERCQDSTAGGMMNAIAHGALMGARGNSGVILSQILRGVARGLDGCESVSARDLSSALGEGAEAAYKAVTKPTEGTILTVARDVAVAAKGATDGGEADIRALLETVVTEADASVARTPTLLPVLAEAGVVDAGGKGLAVLFEGMLRHVRGETLEVSSAERGSVEQGWLNSVEQRHEVESSPYGYCSEVLVEGTDLDVDAMREGILGLGDSVLVVGDERLVRIHVHTDDPGAVLTTGTRVGALVQVKIDNINRQAEQFVAMHGAGKPSVPATTGATGSTSVVAVASGDGLAEVFTSMGCERVVSGGPTMNPSTREILDAIEACGADDVIVLPNDKNIVLAAQQAVPLSKKSVRVVASRSVPQGLAALLAINPEEGAAQNAEAMEGALGGVRTIEITRAVRSTTIGGVEVREGQVIAVVDDVLTLASESPEAAAVEALRPLVSPSTSLITLYFGDVTTEADAQSLADDLRAAMPGHDVEVVHGGQPHYQYIVSLE